MIDTVIDFFKAHAFNVFIILLTASVLRRFAMLFMRQFIRRTIRPESFKTVQDEKQREDTLISTVGAGLRAVIWIITTLLLLSEVGIDIAPLLAGAGIAGVALGFGAQSMVRDFLAGFFILSENQYRVGDVIRINNEVSGKVERVTLRHTMLRDLDGMVHHIPNGEVRLATNMTMEFANVNLDIGVGYETDIGKLEKVINEVGRILSGDPEWRDAIIEAPKFLRIKDFADSAMIVKIVGKTNPMQQWSVTGELRKRLKIAFDKNNIEIPYPQRVVHSSEPKKTKKK
ncbi:mechanosensitive ion channel family protein [Candidatus Saccharibacteria bacterium]|nr:mechanosensitive ion channel family protein [Candidatus Saccharibacteria bacterium]